MESPGSLGESGRAIWQSISAIVEAVGQKDWDQLRGHMRKAAVLFQQLATWAEWGAGLTNDDLGKLIEELEQAGNSDRAFRQMEGLRTYLPAFGGAVGDAAKKTFPKDP